MTNPVGRPTKYSKAMLSGVADYLEKYKELDQVIPTVAGLAVYLGIAKSTLYYWIEDGKNPEFSDALEELADNQEVKLVNNGLDGKFSAVITKLMLCNNHGITDKPEESTGTDQDLIKALSKIAQALPD